MRALQTGSPPVAERRFRQGNTSRYAPRT